ncbi:MAG TPA: hypothetical protein VJ521_00535, partial [Acidobacteriota bacterium]|nr:hypothetical protein [Acidobacteriota bacterium]
MKTNRSIFLLVVMVIIAPAYLKLCAEDIPFGDAKIIIEFNSTDEDIGVQIFLDAEGWKRVSIVAPNGVTIFEAQGLSKLKKQGLTELFFESEEPSLDEVPLAEFLARFPEGEYQFVGTTTEGDRLVGTATFTHNIPDGPSIVLPEKRAVLDPNKVVIQWDPVTT